MTAVEKRRLRRRRRFIRNVKRAITEILLAPARMPRVDVSMAEAAMRASETAGIIFVACLMLHMIKPQYMNVVFVAMAGSVFVVLLLVVKLGDYQDRLEELKNYGLNI